MVARAGLRLCLDGWAGTENWGDYPGLREVSPGSLLMLKPPKSSVGFPAAAGPDPWGRAASGGKEGGT